jgi:hypothetical protein
MEHATIKTFEEMVSEKSKGSEFEFILARAKQRDPTALKVLRNRDFQRRMFIHINKKNQPPEFVIKTILLKIGTAIAIVVVEKLFKKLLKTT